MCIMFKAILILSILVFFNSTNATECNIQFEDKTLCANLTFKQPPSRKESSDFVLEFFDLKTKKSFKPKGEVFAYLWMQMKNGHEHGSEPIKIVEADGKFQASNVWFLMLGTWQLKIQLRKEGKVINKGELLVEIKREAQSKN